MALFIHSYQVHDVKEGPSPFALGAAGRLVRIAHQIKMEAPCPRWARNAIRYYSIMKLRHTYSRLAYESYIYVSLLALTIPPACPPCPHQCHYLISSHLNYIVLTPLGQLELNLYSAPLIRYKMDQKSEHVAVWEVWVIVRSGMIRR